MSNDLHRAQAQLEHARAELEQALRQAGGDGAHPAPADRSDPLTVEPA